MAAHSDTERRVLVISHDRVGATMAGPGIRYYHMARILARHASVTLAVPQESTPSAMELGEQGGFAIHRYTRRHWPSIRYVVEQADVIVLPSDIAADFPQLARSTACLAVDGYDPLLAEWLALNANTISGLDDPNLKARWQQRMQELSWQYQLGDFFVCASERQRDWWLGLLEANGRVNPWTFAQDASLRRLVDVAPFGLPETPPRHTEAVVKGLWPGIARTDTLLLWGGGLWPWLDPLTAIRAVAKVHEQRQDVRLIFPGTAHPNPYLADMPTHTQAAQTLADDLGLTDRVVFFGEWVAYADWPNVLLESDLALSLHFNTLETRLAFRSRLLETIWAGLPVVATKGDVTSQLVDGYGIGTLVNSEDVDGVATAILHLLTAPCARFEPGFEQARRDLSWERTLSPLVAFCRHPRPAADKKHLSVAADSGASAFVGELHVQEMNRLLDERDHWRALAEAYANGRFMRLIRWIHGVKRRLFAGRRPVPQDERQS